MSRELGGDSLLIAQGLSKCFSGRGRATVTALDHVDLSVPRRSTMLLTGPSGCGKSTLARCLAGLEIADSGLLKIAGRNFSMLDRKSRVAYYTRIQLISQDPGGSLNPNWSALDIVCEPLDVQGWGEKAARRSRALERLQWTGLPAASGGWRPTQFSGGQRARLALARALTLEPELLILDETLSNLDTSLQARMINLLLDLQDRLGLTYLFIGHRVSLLARVADSVAIMRQGRILGVVSARDYQESLPGSVEPKR